MRCRPAQDETTMNKVVSQSVVIQVCQKRLFKPSIRFGFPQVHPHLATRSHSGQLRFERAPLALSLVHAASALERRGGRRLQRPLHGPRAWVPPGRCTRWQRQTQHSRNPWLLIVSTSRNLWCLARLGPSLIKVIVILLCFLYFEKSCKH